jgi:hypothetical protein
MNWAGITSIFILSTVKFSVSTIPGPGLNLSFLETFLAAFLGGSVSAAFFYFASDFVIQWMQKRRLKKEQLAISQGQVIQKKKIFTKLNRFIFILKSKLAIYGICFWVPFFFSVPLGCIIVAKLYGKEARTYPLIVLGMAINALITTSLVYGIHGFF